MAWKYNPFTDEIEYKFTEAEGDGLFLRLDGSNTMTGEINTSNAVGFRIDTLRDFWFSKYPDAVAPNTGIFFNYTSGGLVDFVYLGNANASVNVTNGNITGNNITAEGHLTVGDGDTDDPFIAFSGTSYGEFKWDSSEDEFVFPDRVKMMTQGLYFPYHHTSPTVNWNQGDKISLFENRFGQADMYGFGVDSNILYLRSPANIDFQIAEQNSQSVKNYHMRLNDDGLVVKGDVSLTGEVKEDTRPLLRYSLLLS